MRSLPEGTMAGSVTIHENKNKESALLSIREKLLATGEEKLKKGNVQLEKEQALLRNNKDLLTKRNEMARKDDLSMAKREQVMVRREEVFFQRELEMKKDKENTEKEKSQNAAFSRSLAKEKEEQENNKVKFKRREQKLFDDLEMRESKLKVDIRTFDKQKNQQRMLNAFRQYSGEGTRGSISSIRCSGSKGSSCLRRGYCSPKSSKNSRASRSCSRSSDFSNLMGPDPWTEVNRSSCPATMIGLI